MISYEEAIRILLQAEKLSSSAVPINKSYGRVAAETISSELSVPPFANSAMDGFAVRSADIATASADNPSALRISGSTMAGDIPSEKSGGGAWEIMTGAAIPQGYDAVVKLEDVKLSSDGNEVVFTAPAKPQQNIRSAGEDFAVGDMVTAAGITITPLHVMALATIGRATVQVYDKPRITVITTGKEVIDDTEAELLPGQIRNSNSPYLLAALAEMGIDADYGGVIRDEPQAFMDKVKQYSASSDIIISTGAVSAGKHDFIPDSLREMGAEILFHKVAIRPGKPVLYARLADGTHYFGLPGNPVSAVVGLRFFVVPLMLHLQGMAAESPVTARLAMPFPKKQGLRFFRKAYIAVAEGGRLQMEILKGQESFKIKPLLRANCWASFAAEQTGLEVGNAIEVYPLTADRWLLENVTWQNHS